MVDEKVDTILEILEDEFRDFTPLQYVDGLSALRDRIDEMLEAAIANY